MRIGGEQTVSISDLFPLKEESINRIYSILTGVVTDIEDPDHGYRVRVRLLNRDTSDYETDFIRVGTMMSGSGYGSFFLPEVGDEVLVAFEDGIITRPYVIGSLWNQKNKPPVERKEKENLIRELKTKRGHTVIFHDEDGKDSIEIQTPKGIKISLEDEKETLLFSDKNGKNKIQIDSANGILTLLAEKKISLQAGGSKLELDDTNKSVLLESGQSLNIKSQQVVIQAKGTMDVKSSGSLNLKSDGPANIKGAVVKLN